MRRPGPTGAARRYAVLTADTSNSSVTFSPIISPPVPRTAGRQADETTFELTGDLTIKGVTKPVTVPFTYEGSATDPYGNLRVGFEGSVVVNRKDYGITWNAALETGGVLVSDKITLEFEISAIKSA